MKKFISIFCVIAMALSMAIPCAATTIEENPATIVEESTELLGLETIRNMSDHHIVLTENNERGTSSPTTAVNCHASGLVTFEGDALWSTLWLDNYIYGCSSYKVKVENYHSEPLTFDVRGTTADTHYTLASGFSKYYYPLNMATTDTLFCISFRAPSNFAGWVECNCPVGG